MSYDISFIVGKTKLLLFSLNVLTNPIYFIVNLFGHYNRI